MPKEYKLLEQVGLYYVKTFMQNLDNLLMTLWGRCRIPGRSKMEVCVSAIISGKQRWKNIGDANYSPFTLKQHGIMSTEESWQIEKKKEIWEAIYGINLAWFRSKWI